MSLKLCPGCGFKKIMFVFNEEKGEHICYQCNSDLQVDKEDLEDVMQIKLPGGIVAFWIDSSSYNNKEKNQRYFKIPDGSKKAITHGKDYKVMIQEV